jgi:hypothetical protein
MTTTAIEAVLNGLYDTVIADATIAAGIAAETLRVYDGPGLTDFSGPTIVTIGARPVVDDESVTSAEFSWASLGVDGAHADVDEHWEIPCGISTRDANSVMRTARATAFTWTRAIHALVRNSSLGVPTVVLACQPQITQVRQMRGQSGCDVIVNFSVVVWTRI